MTRRPPFRGSPRPARDADLRGGGRDSCRCRERQVRRLVAAGALPVHRFGAAVRISRDDLARYIAAARHS